jgi:sensor domain CHASE-containing protein
MQRFVFWMQQSHDLSQTSLSFWQRKFIVVESWHNRNQLYIRGNIQTSNATTDFFDATATSAIATNFTL